jgi:hypothetical protein
MGKRSIIMIMSVLAVTGAVALAGLLGGCSSKPSGTQGTATSSSASTAAAGAAAASANGAAGAGSAAGTGTAGGSGTTAPPVAVAPQAPVAPEKSPPGDIPDNQVFVPYTPASGALSISVPEGWSRKAEGSKVTFTDKLNTIVLTWAPAASAPTVGGAKTATAAQLAKTELAFQLVGVKEAALSAGKAVVLQYRENSAPSDVTGKQYRLDVQRYQLFKNGEQADITLLSPVGADNVDPWRIVTRSFKWLR